MGDSSVFCVHFQITNIVARWFEKLNSAVATYSTWNVLQVFPSWRWQVISKIIFKSMNWIAWVDFLSSQFTCFTIPVALGSSIMYMLILKRKLPIPAQFSETLGTQCFRGHWHLTFSLFFPMIFSISPYVSCSMSACIVTDLSYFRWKTPRMFHYY